MTLLLLNLNSELIDLILIEIGNFDGPLTVFIMLDVSDLAGMLDNRHSSVVLEVQQHQQPTVHRP